MKIVINKRHGGGFSLSTAAMKRAISESAAGIEIIKGINSDEFCDAGDGYEVGTVESTLYKNGTCYTFRDYMEEFRSDPVLVRIVEEMGEAVNGRYTDLKVVEIPDGIDWEIVEYDGKEHIAERHRTWG